MSMTTDEAEKLLELYFNNLDHAAIGDAGGLKGSTAAGSMQISLHHADPGEAGDQTTSEVAYGGYARVAVGRTTGGWAVSSAADPAVADNVSAVSFPTATSGTTTATYFGVGSSATGAGLLLFSGQITSPGGGLAISNGITPEFPIGDLDVTAD